MPGSSAPLEHPRRRATASRSSTATRTARPSRNGQPNCQAGQTGYALGEALLPGQSPDNPTFGVPNIAKAAGVPPLGKTNLFLEQNGDRVFGPGQGLTVGPNSESASPTSTIGLIAIVLVFIGFYLAFTKTIPFVGHGYELKAVVPGRSERACQEPGADRRRQRRQGHRRPAPDGDANGEGEDAAVVTMELKDDGAARSTRTRRCSCGRASSSRATCSSTCTRAARARRS